MVYKVLSGLIDVGEVIPDMFSFSYPLQKRQLKEGIILYEGANLMFEKKEASIIKS